MWEKKIDPDTRDGKIEFHRASNFPFSTHGVGGWVGVCVCVFFSEAFMKRKFSVQFIWRGFLHTTTHTRTRIRTHEAHMKQIRLIEEEKKS